MVYGLEPDPDAAFVVTATIICVAIMALIVVTPPLMEIPVVIVGLRTDVVPISVAVIGMPAIAIAAADHAGRGGRSGGKQRAAAHKQSQGGG